MAWVALHPDAVGQSELAAENERWAQVGLRLGQLSRENADLKRIVAAVAIQQGITINQLCMHLGLPGLEHYFNVMEALTAEIGRLRDLIRTAHDNADYIVSMLKSESDAVSIWPQTRHAVLLLKAEGIMALEDEMRHPTTDVGQTA